MIRWLKWWRWRPRPHPAMTIHHTDQHLWAEVEELPGCFAAGRDMPELNEAMEEAISMYLAPRDVLAEQILAAMRRRP